MLDRASAMAEAPSDGPAAEDKVFLEGDQRDGEEGEPEAEEEWDLFPDLSLEDLEERVASLQ